MVRDNIKPDYTHGSTGIKPSTALNFEENQRPDSENFDWQWYVVFERLKDIVDEFNAIDSDGDSVVDEANNADKLDGHDWSEVSSVVGSSDADSVDGQHWTDIQSWVNNSSDVPNADTVDGKHWTDIQYWVNNSSDVPDSDRVDGQHWSDIKDWVNTNVGSELDSHKADSDAHHTKPRNGIVHEEATVSANTNTTHTYLSNISGFSSGDWLDSIALDAQSGSGYSNDTIVIVNYNDGTSETFRGSENPENNRKVSAELNKGGTSISSVELEINNNSSSSWTGKWDITFVTNP